MVWSWAPQLSHNKAGTQDLGSPQISNVEFVKFTRDETADLSSSQSVGL